MVGQRYATLVGPVFKFNPDGERNLMNFNYGFFNFAPISKEQFGTIDDKIWDFLRSMEREKGWPVTLSKPSLSSSRMNYILEIPQKMHDGRDDINMTLYKFEIFGRNNGYYRFYNSFMDSVFNSYYFEQFVASIIKFHREIFDIDLESNGNFTINFENMRQQVESFDELYQKELEEETEKYFNEMWVKGVVSGLSFLRNDAGNNS